MKKKKQMKIILAVVTIIAVLISGWVMMKPGGLFAEEPELQPSIPGEKTKIAVQVSSPDLVQTYKDYETGSMPADLPLTVKVHMSQAGIEGTSVKIPLTGFIPKGQTGGGQPYAGFTMEDPIYDKTPANIDEIRDHSMVQDAKVDGNDDLVISFKTTKKIAFTLNIYFAFNMDYLAKIPAEHCVWNEAQAFVYADGATSPDALSNQVTVKTNAKNSYSFGRAKTFPGSNNYINGAITLYMQVQDFAYSQWDVMSGTDYTFYIDVPNGFNVQTIANPGGVITKYEKYKEDITPGITRFIATMKPSDVVPGKVPNNTVSVTPASNFPIGEEFSISYGVYYTKYNADEINTPIHTWKLIKKDDVFSIAVPNTIQRVVASLGKAAVVNMNSDEPMDVPMHFSREGTNEATIQNDGTIDIKGVKLTLLQLEEGDPKINFASFTQRNGVPFIVEFSIKNASDGTERTWDNNEKVYSGNVNVDLPTLNENDYIRAISLIPKVEGKEVGVLPAGKNINSQYRAKRWLSDCWPGQTSLIDQSKSYPIKMGAKMEYIDENGQKKELTQDYFNKPYIYYAPYNAIQATTKMFTNSVGVGGGEITYSLQSYLSGPNTLGPWENPVVYFAVPKEMALTGPSGILGKNEELPVNTELNAVGDSVNSTIKCLDLPEADANYNYYSIVTNGNFPVPPSNLATTLVATTKLNFKVSSSAKKGTYPVPVVVATNQNAADSVGNNLFVQSIPTAQPMGNIKDVLEDNPTLLATMQNILENNQNYTAFGASENTPLTVIEGGAIVETTTFQTGKEVFWNAPTTGGTTVNSGTSVRLKSEFSNSSKTNTYNNVRLYYLLPDAKDLAFQGLNTDWLEELTDAQKVGLEVYYTTADTEDLVPYEEADIKNWYEGGNDGDEAVLNEMRFTRWGDLENLPTDKPITGLYVTYAQQGANPILPAGEMLDTVLDFEVPGKTSAPYNSVANLTYKYAAKSVDDGDIITNMSDTVQINTQTVIQLTYDANLPEGVTDSPTDMPKDPDPIEVDADGKATYEIPTLAPSLADYTFEGWQLKIDGKLVTEGEENPVPVVYLLGDTLSLDASKGLNWTLVAQWEPKYSITVSSSELTFEQTKVPLSTSKTVIPRISEFTINTTAPTGSDYSVDVSLQGDFASKKGEKELSLSDILTFKKAENANPVPLKGTETTPASLKIFEGSGANALKLGEPNIGDFVLDLDYVQAMPIEFFLKATSQQTTGAEFTATIEFTLTAGS